MPKAKRGRPASWKAPRQGRWSETASTVQRRNWRQLARTTKDDVHHAICSNVSGFWATFFAQGEGVGRDHVRNLCVAKCDGLAGWLSEQYRAFGGKCHAVYADGKFVNEAAQKALTNQRSEHGLLESTTSWERGLPARAERPPQRLRGQDARAPRRPADPGRPCSRAEPCTQSGSHKRRLVPLHRGLDRLKIKHARTPLVSSAPSLPVKLAVHRARDGAAHVPDDSESIQEVDERRQSCDEIVAPVHPTALW